MSTNDEITQNFREGLNSVGDALQEILNKPVVAPEPLDRAISGNKINGGKITNFSSVGIDDKANKTVLTVSNDGLHVTAMHVNSVENSLNIKGALTVDGEITATKLHVNEISADIRNERTEPLQFLSEGNKPAFGKGLIWPSSGTTKQFTLQSKPDRLFSSEIVDLQRDRHFSIGNTEVLSLNQLGNTVVRSNLQTVGTLENLSVDGNVDIDNFVYWDSDTQRLGLGCADPNGALAIRSLDHEFVIDPTEDKKFKLGTWSTSNLQIITDDTTRIEVDKNGTVDIYEDVRIKNSIGVGVKNYSKDASITTSGPVRFQTKKFEVANNIPTSGTYSKGDIIWNDAPAPSGYVGWICVREGTPGMWNAFGQISK